MEPLTTTELAAIWEAVHEPYRLSVSYVVRTVQIRRVWMTLRASGAGAGWIGAAQERCAAST